MSDHTLWKGITPLPDPRAREVQQAYIDGYCLAMEDVLEEMTRIAEYQIAATENLAVGASSIVTTTHRPLRKFVGKALQQARDTLRHLRRLHEQVPGDVVSLDRGSTPGTRGDDPDD
jgi:hypothetical protein